VTENSNEFFRNLTTLSEEAFPKYCKTCDKVYQSAQDFVDKTESISGKSGLKGSFDDQDLPIVELYRNCSCGSTLMDFFSDRRDGSEKGLKRRALFEQLLKTLVTHQIPHRLARDELLRMLRGGKSELIENLGLVRIRQASNKNNP
jgi:hypothetical protein